MKILVLTSLYPPHYVGGYELQCKNQTDELVARGHEVSVLTSRWGQAEGKIEGKVYRLLHCDETAIELNEGNTSAIPKQGFRVYDRIRWAGLCRANYRIAQRVISIVRPELVYIWHMGLVSINPVLASQALGLPTVFNIGDYWLADLKARTALEPNPLKRKLRKSIIGLKDFSQIKVSHILVNSHYLLQSHKKLGFAASSIAVVQRGIPTELLISASELEDKFKRKRELKLLFAGRLVIEKGPDVAIEAVSLLARTRDDCRITLDIVGLGNNAFEQQLREQVAILNLQDQVRFLGKVPRLQLLERYSKYDALLFTSRWEEPFGGTILEAMARGLPVIATAVGGIPELVHHHKTGLLVAPDEPKILAEAVTTLIQAPALAQKVQHSALNLVREKYLFKQVMDRTESYLSEVNNSSTLTDSEGMADARQMDQSSKKATGDGA
jgi:glycogen synthase